MNSTQAREISLEKILQNLGFEPLKSNQLEFWYLSPFRLEKTPSFKLNLKLNRWYDHGEQIGGNTLDFVVHKFGYTVKESLNYLEAFSNLPIFSFQKQNIASSEIMMNKNNNSILKVIAVQHIALKQYLAGRFITKAVVHNQIKEVHYEINQKSYFAIGFKNKSDGWELRSKYAKICLGKKDITKIDNQCTALRIFEGFFDYLSFLQIENNKLKENSDYLILNSAALITKNIVLLEDYKTIELYLDNDETGEKYSNFITSKYNNAIDFRWMYKGCKDLNEWLMKYYLEA